MSWELLLNSFGLATMVSFFAVLIGWSVAVFLASTAGRWRIVLLGGSIAAFSLPPFLMVNTWLGLLGNVGVLKPVLPLNVYSFGGAVWLLTLMLWPVPCLMSYGALKRLTPELLDAEPGLGGWPLIKEVLLPLSGSALLQSGVIVFALAFNNIAVPAILQVNVFPAQFWVEFSSTYNFKMAWQYGWVLALMPFGVLLVLRGQEIAWPWESQGVPAEQFADRLGQALRRIGAGVAVLAVVISFLLPLGHLLVDARTWSDFPDAIRAGARSIWNSLWFAAGTSVLVVGLGALFSDQKGGRLAWLLFFLPGVLLGVVLISVFNRPWLGWFYGGSGVVFAALGLRYFALGQALGGCRSSTRLRPLRRAMVAALVALVFAAGRLGDGGGVVRSLSAMPVGHGDGGVDRAAWRRDAGAAGIQPPALRAPRAGECTVPHPVAARCTAANRRCGGRCFC